MHVFEILAELATPSIDILYRIPLQPDRPSTHAQGLGARARRLIGRSSPASYCAIGGMEAAVQPGATMLTPVYVRSGEVFSKCT